MKLFKFLAPLALLLLSSNAFATSWNMLMPGSAGQYCAKSGTCYTPASTGVVSNVVSTDILSLIAQGGVVLNQNAATYGVPFSTTQTSNPLLMATVVDVPVASANATGGYTFIAGISGRKIYPTGLAVTAIGGTGSASTGIKVLCTSGNVLASIAVGNLVNSTPVPFGSAAMNPGVAFAQGCVAGDGVYVSNIGSALATTTDLLINMPYTVQ